MSIESLKNLRNALEKNHWRINQELPGDDYHISGYWEISRPNGDSKFVIEFEGLDDMETLPMNKAYGFRLSEHPNIGAYMGSRKTKSWPKELNSFIGLLNGLDA